MTDRGLEQSIRARLLNESKRTGADPNVVLSRYGLERFLERGESNSRMKDFFDVAELAARFSFEGLELADAIRSTLENARREYRMADP